MSAKDTFCFVENDGSVELPSNTILVAVSRFVGMVIGKFPAICKKTFSKLVFNKKPSAEKLLKRYLYVGNKKNVSAKDTFCFVENDGSAELPSNATLVAVSRFVGMVIGKFTVICKKLFQNLFSTKSQVRKNC